MKSSRKMSSLPIVLSISGVPSITKCQFESFLNSVGLKYVVGSAERYALGGWQVLISPYTTQRHLDFLNSRTYQGTTLYFAFYPRKQRVRRILFKLWLNFNFIQQFLPTVVQPVPSTLTPEEPNPFSSSETSHEEEKRVKEEKKKAKRERRRRRKYARILSSSSSEAEEEPGRYAVPLENSD